MPDLRAPAPLLPQPPQVIVTLVPHPQMVGQWSVNVSLVEVPNGLLGALKMLSMGLQIALEKFGEQLSDTRVAVVHQMPAETG
jgi:ABC-type nitrate/sulfonate/bicarbonate transport system permease component